MDIFEDWAILEADFRREYGIDLVNARLSWRAFLIYANHLSPNSLWVLTYDGRAKGTATIENDEAGEAIFEREFGGE